MPTIKLELDYGQYDWLAKNTKDPSTLLRSLLADEIGRRSARDCSALYTLAKPWKKGNMVYADDVLALAREYAKQCRDIAPESVPTHKYSRGGADIFGMCLPGSLRDSDGALPVTLDKDLRLAGMTFNTGLGRDTGKRWIGFNMRMLDGRRHTVILKKFGTATEAQCDELAGIFGRHMNPDTGAYTKTDTGY